ncbi:rod shape-determining protein MreC [Vulgatibacter incomptus]|uniref:Cell shape-determining protein MreC n=1 Tax=Vulgatibacter incomptus TaxID=1391653 RepID=A0A0K1PCT2_9BACT|nr:rod shape-determining protein MreC [Vulgatibacter incomptus]AKU91206.1 Rod shape-determining protein MreC [Vulgatibacter incomptus]
MLAIILRYRELLLVAVLLLLPAGTYVANAKQARDLSSLDKLCLAVSAPLSRAIDGAVGGAIDLWTGYVALRGVREENLQLREALAEARALASERLEAGLENERLQELLSFSRASKGRVVAAPVIGVSPTHRRVITISAGEGSGIATGMAVVTANGVVGKVIATYGHEADVQLVVDSSSAVAARVQRSRARVTVRGTGEEKSLQLANALRTDDIEAGDVLITSGTDRVFPKGLVIGRIGPVRREAFGMYLEGTVLPAVDVSGLEEVLVLVAPADGTPPPTVQTFEEKGGVLPGLP